MESQKCEGNQLISQKIKVLRYTRGIQVLSSISFHSIPLSTIYVDSAVKSNPQQFTPSSNPGKSTKIDEFIYLSSHHLSKRIHPKTNAIISTLRRGPDRTDHGDAGVDIGYHHSVGGGLVPGYPAILPAVSPTSWSGAIKCFSKPSCSCCSHSI